MSKMNLNKLRALREQKRCELGLGDGANNTVYVVVGMGTSGIAAGARETFDTLSSELEFHELTNVVLKQTGSLGLDHAEPTVEVRMPGMPPIIYGKVDSVVASKIVRKHILEKTLVNAHVFDQRAVDIVQGAQLSGTEAG